jgi:Uma2 family endonuclease
MTVDEFLAWAVKQEKGRYELLRGWVVMQQPQTWRHAELRVHIYNLLVAAVERAGVPYFAGPDGMTVRIGEDEALSPMRSLRGCPSRRGSIWKFPVPCSWCRCFRHPA